MKLFALIIITTVSLFSIVYGKENKYSLADLESLQKNQNWLELLEHIEDVSPSERNQQWEEMLIIATEKGFDFFEQDQYSYRMSWYTDRIISRYPQVRKDKAFMFKLAKKVRLSISDTEAIKYFDWAIDEKTTTVQCSDSDLLTSVESSLKNLSPKHSNISHVKKVAFGHCLSFLKPAIKAALRDKNGHSMNNACSEMIQQDALTGISKKRCQRHLGELK